MKTLFTLLGALTAFTCVAQKDVTKTLFISNHDQDNPKKIAEFFENKHDTIIDFKGKTLNCKGTTLPFVFQNCQRITLRNLTIDFDLPHLRQLTIVKVNKRKGYCLARITNPDYYAIREGKLHLFGDAAVAGGNYDYVPEVAMAFSPDGHLAYRRPNVDFSVQRISEVEKGLLKIEGWSQIPFTRIGERFALRNYQRPTPAIFIDGCKDIRLEHITIRYAWGMGVLAQMSENITLDSVTIGIASTTDPAQKRFFTTQGDATHFSGCKGLILSENGLYEGMADDAINVHGTYLRLTERIDNHTVRARYMHPQTYGFKWGEVGDTLQIIRSKTMDIVDTGYKITAIKAVDAPSDFGTKEFEIQVDRPLPTFEEGESYGLENLTWTPQVIFRNNIVRNNRARGALFSTPRKVLCKNNVFDHTHGAAILLCGDCNGWYETGACRNVTIRGNRFINALTANYQFTNAIISIYPEIPDLVHQKGYFHSGITIEDNTFETFDEPILYAKSVDGLVFKNNKVIKNKAYKPFHNNKKPILLERVINSKIEDISY
ncbi:hypothetical protein SAMN05444369_10579 [Capnocytophaga haemolytica]|uniref:Alpha-1,3-galactosidase B n=1 Tax=Capnocytophaga haemolytica TaxID=45243 RepID=A0AAX2H122_9FLAO|nr:right-handed parallel beta-helix repeat-containing protein [Capnocytophaga haemolytica]AMD84216.1 alpha-1,3-galactosidase B [Capnocytophaga haemolytica]SFN94629.1 hypothetical protein SAMN05444369_10579 [Capnocytophaga haemolytica]SNV12619.1 Alpha-1,3-galactosidase B precursor [Capnocytophaga haemolytica]